MHVSARAHTPISTHDRTHTHRQTYRQTQIHTLIHDTNIGRILAFVTCLGNTYMHMRMHISTSMCASAA